MENLNKTYFHIQDIVFFLIFTMLLFLSSCSLTSYYVDPIYEDHPHTTEIYFYGTDVYFGYHSGFYYYYGVPHFYPWWYYYQFIPPHHFHTHTHIYVHCSDGHYVYGHRGPTINNNVARDFTPTIKIKNSNDKSFVFPRNWKSSNSTRVNKQNELKYNISKQNYNRTFNLNNSNTKNSNKSINYNKNKSNNRSNNKSSSNRNKRP